MTKQLYPPLSQITASLFGISNDLLLKLAHDDKNIPPAVKQAALSDPAVLELLDSIKQLPEDSPDNTETEIPEFIQNLIHRRVAAQQANFSSYPSSGQLVRIDQVTDIKHRLDWQLNSPLVVLLDAPSQESSDIWHAWLVGSETDYATNWDVLLEPEDEPFDPLAGIVQVWNPVYFWIKQGAKVIGELSARRMQVVRAVAAEFISTDDSKLERPTPGFIGLRTTLHDFSVLTGSPLGNENDPRYEYQNLYFQVAAAVREPAKIALAANLPQPINLFEKIANWLSDWGRTQSDILRPDTLIAQPMGDKVVNREQQTFKLKDYLIITLLAESDQLVKLHLQRINPSLELTIKFYKDDSLVNVLTLNSDQEITEYLSADESYYLVVNVKDGEQGLKIPFIQTSD